LQLRGCRLLTSKFGTTIPRRALISFLFRRGSTSRRRHITPERASKYSSEYLANIRGSMRAEASRDLGANPALWESFNNASGFHDRNSVIMSIPACRPRRSRPGLTIGVLRNAMPSRTRRRIGSDDRPWVSIITSELPVGEFSHQRERRPLRTCHDTQTRPPVSADLERSTGSMEVSSLHQAQD
jgi:hypothetical protein